MQKLKLLFIGFGFFWIFAWSVFGSLLGAKINLIVVSGADPTWLIGLQKNLLTAAHSHMNSMAIGLILFALTMGHISAFISKYTIKIICFTNLISIPMFGFGMFFEAFYPPVAGHFSIFTALVALGAILYMITMMCWASFFILGYMKSK